MRRTTLFFSYLILIISLFNSCKKHEEVVVDGNTPPPDHTVPQATKDSYVNRVYISILGREADSTELAEAQVIINKNNFSLGNRQQLLDSVLSRPEYIYRTYQITRENLINGTDTSQVTFYIGVYNALLTNVSYQSAWPAIKIEIDRFTAMKKIPADLISGAITIRGMYKRCIDNGFYDMINMGTENFVVSVYQNLFFRYPSTTELADAKIMVDGQPSNVLLQSGKNKTDFIDIIFNSTDYYEGTVRALYKRYLFREPTSLEMAAKTVLYKNSDDYKALQKDILSSNEYAGIK